MNLGAVVVERTPGSGWQPHRCRGGRRTPSVHTDGRACPYRVSSRMHQGGLPRLPRIAGHQLPAGDQEINLFGVCVDHLLRDYDYTPPGGKPTTLGALWAAVDGADKTVAIGHIDGRHSPRLVGSCKLLNDALTEVLPKLHPVVNTLLNEMGHGELEITNLVYAPVGLKAAWNLDQRGLTGGTIRPTVSYRNYQPNRAQHFLNEARLSALALAIYFAGRLVCTPSGDDGALKLCSRRRADRPGPRQSLACARPAGKSLLVLAGRLAHT